VEQGEGKAARVAAEEDAAVTSAGGLAAIFAGYLEPRQLAQLGLVQGLTTKDLEFLEAVRAGPCPWSPDFY
jgi:hypothetical protein